MNQADLAEHSTTLIVLISVLFSLLVAMVCFIFNYVVNGLKLELRRLSQELGKINDEIFPRLRSLESSEDRLWSEHRMMMKMGGHLHIHSADEEDNAEDTAHPCIKNRQEQPHDNQ